MQLGLLLWLLGLIFLALEFYLPGGFFGAAALFCFASTLSTWYAAGLSAPWLACAAVLLLLSVMIASSLALKTLRSGAMIEAKSEQGHLAASFSIDSIGRPAVAVTDLGPSGFVLLGQERIAAISKGGYLPKGSEVLVVGGEGFSVWVTPKRG